jgi:hypothetical protein
LRELSVLCPDLWSTRDVRSQIGKRPIGADERYM